jgi:hypothetical protein
MLKRRELLLPNCCPWGRVAPEKRIEQLSLKKRKEINQPLMLI